MSVAEEESLPHGNLELWQAGTNNGFAFLALRRDRRGIEIRLHAREESLRGG